MTKRPLLSGFVLSAALVVPPVSAQANPQTNEWLAWHGCWRAAGAPVGEALCVVPDGIGVRMLTVQGGTVVGEARVVTDGQPRQVEQDGCRGTELALWAVDRQRVFLRSDLTCEGNVTRRANGILSFTSPSQWVSVQSITIGDRSATRTVRYGAVEPGQLPSAVTNALRASDPYARMAARRNLLEAIDQNDVTEAVNSVDAVAAQEWLRETGQPFELADDRDAAAETIVSGSALELTARGASHIETTRAVYQPREVVHIVERPVYVSTRHVHHVVRSCWDPFFGGWVSVGRGVRVGVNYHSGGCGHPYYGWYSPWGYDLFGWRLVPRPLVIVRGGPIIIRPSRYHRDDYRSYDRYNDRPVVRVNNDTRDYRPTPTTNWVAAPPVPPSPARKEQTSERWSAPPQGPSRTAKSNVNPVQARVPAPPSRVNKSSGDWTSARSSKSVHAPAAPRVSKSSGSPSSVRGSDVPRVNKPPKSRN